MTSLKLLGDQSSLHPKTFSVVYQPCAIQTYLFNKISGKFSFFDPERNDLFLQGIKGVFRSSPETSLKNILIANNHAL